MLNPDLRFCLAVVIEGPGSFFCRRKTGRAVAKSIWMGEAYGRHEDSDDPDTADDEG